MKLQSGVGVVYSSTFYSETGAPVVAECGYSWGLGVGGLVGWGVWGSGGWYALQHGGGGGGKDVNRCGYCWGWAIEIDTLE